MEVANATQLLRKSGDVGCHCSFPLTLNFTRCAYVEDLSRPSDYRSDLPRHLILFALAGHNHKVPERSPAEQADILRLPGALRR